MGRHQDAVQVGVFGNPLQLSDSTDICWIGPHNIDRMTLDQILEVLAQIDLFTCVNWGGGRLGQVPIYVGIHIGNVIPCEHVLQPHQVVGLNSSGKA